MFNDCIIMAGGFGTKLWPASTSSAPKQLMKLPVALCGVEDIIVAARAGNCERHQSHRPHGTVLKSGIILKSAI